MHYSLIDSQMSTNQICVLYIMSMQKGHRCNDAGSNYSGDDIHIYSMLIIMHSSSILSLGSCHFTWFPASPIFSCFSIIISYSPSSLLPSISLCFTNANIFINNLAKQPECSCEVVEGLEFGICDCSRHIFILWTHHFIVSEKVPSSFSNLFPPYNMERF